MAAAREDRFSRRLGDRTLPLAAVAYCLRAARVGPADLAAVVLAGTADDWREHGEYPPTGRGDSPLRAWLRRRFGLEDDPRTILARDLDPSVPVLFLEPERADLAGFLASPFHSAAIVRLGEGGAIGAGYGEGDTLRPIPDVPADPVAAARHLHATTGADRLVVTGSGAGSASLGRLRRESIFQDVWAHPAAATGAAAIGGALHFWCVDSAQPRPAPGDAGTARARGPGYNAHQIRTFLRSRGVVPEEVPRSSFASRVGDLLAEGRAVAWFQGRLDLDDETAASRSILASPGNEAAREATVAVTAESAGAVFGEARPRGEAVVASSWRDRVGRSPAPFFVVERDDHRPLHDVLTAFTEITELPFVFARPLQVEGEPVACTPRDAYDAFLSLAVDVLVIGPYLVRQPAPAGSPVSVPLTGGARTGDIE